MWYYKENQGDPPIRPSSLGTAKGLDVVILPSAVVITGATNQTYEI